VRFELTTIRSNPSARFKRINISDAQQNRVFKKMRLTPQKKLRFARFFGGNHEKQMMYTSHCFLPGTLLGVSSARELGSFNKKYSPHSHPHFLRN